MSKDIHVYLQDIYDSLEKIQEYTKDVSESDFYEDTELQDAVERRLEIIGEAVKNIPGEFKDKHTAVPWRQIAGMRDVLIHEYSAVELDRIWKVVTDEVGKLKATMQKLLKNLD